MKTALMDVFNGANSLTINKGTIKSLVSRQLLNDSGTLTHEGWLLAMSNLSLKRQCELLDLQCDAKKWEKTSLTVGGNKCLPVKEPALVGLNDFDGRGFL